MRGFNVVKGYSKEDVILPKRQTANSAGYDFYSAEEITIKPHCIAIVKTGVKAYMESDEVLELFIRSSMPIKKGITLANNVGIIDSDYYENPDNDGHIQIQVINFSDTDVVIKKGDRIAQGIFTKFLLACDDSATGERNGGFGSTSK